jgi:transcriptional regulator GlxA family with amidase domain
MTRHSVEASHPQQPPAAEDFHVGFVLLHDFSMIAFANAVETLRMANYISRRALYRWTVVHAEPSQPVASNGLTVSSSGSAEDLASCDLVFVCGGLNIRQVTTEPVRRLLRQCAARGAAMGALCTGSFALASAGLLDDHRCAIHWENLAAISEEFPRVRFTPEVFIFDRDRITCSGGTAPLHMVLHLIRGHHGPKLVMAVSEQFIVERLRASSDRQRIPQPECIGPGYQHLTEAAEIMAANIEEPLSLIELAGLVGLSLRQLERLFNRYFSMNPAQYYMNLRLRRAQELLTHSSQPIMQVTVACGFQSSSHFCKAYRSLFGHAPSDERRQQAEKADKAGASRVAAPQSPPRLVRVA